MLELSPQPSQPTSPPVQPEPKKGVSWKKIIASVVVILVVVGAIAGALYWYFVLNEEEATTPITPAQVSTPSAKKATPSAEKDETADWETYKNTNYNYSLKYPASSGVFNNNPQELVTPATTPHLLLTDDPSMNQNKRVQTSDVPKKYLLLEILISGKSGTKYENVDIDELAKEDYSLNKGSSKTITELKKINFSDETAYTYQTAGSSSFNYFGGNGWVLEGESLKIIQLEHSNKVFYFIYRPDNTIEKVLSTFKFLE
jgi:hypothetical protein